MNEPHQNTQHHRKWGHSKNAHGCWGQQYILPEPIRQLYNLILYFSVYLSFLFYLPEDGHMIGWNM